MGAHQFIDNDPLLAGFFTMKDVARLLRTDNQSKLRGWLNGWPNSRSAPILSRDFRDTSTVSFLDLMELRFIEHFRGVGVSLQTLRRAAESAREDWDQAHPFALSKAKYLTDRRSIFAKAAQETGDEATWNLATKQYEMWDTIEETIDHGVTYDPSSDLARSWQPDQRFPNVRVDPRRAFGAPTIGRGIPTRALFNQYRAEANRGGAERVAKWYGTTPELVSEAVKFEITLAS